MPVRSKSSARETFDMCSADVVGVPDAPRSVELTETRPDGVVLTVEPPDEDGGMPVIGYRVHYGDAVTHDVTSSGIRARYITL